MSIQASNAIVDWLQFTVPVEPGSACALRYIIGEPGRVPDAIFNMLIRWGMAPATAHELTKAATAQACAASAPYNQGLRAAGVFWYWHDQSTEVDSILCQITGEGCRRLRESGVLLDIMREVHNRVSRVDVAMDFETEEPLESLFKTDKRLSYINSRSGQTFYIGSMKSDTYARFYRYEHPHPRGGFARLECVYRRKYAAAAVRQIVEMGVERAYASMVMGHKITLREDIATLMAEGERMRVAPPVNTGAESTLRWLIEVCAPAYRRLCIDGVIADPDKFIDEHFKGI